MSDPSSGSRRAADMTISVETQGPSATALLRGNDISDGPTGNSSYLVDVPNGGDLLMEHNTLSKGPHTDNESTAVSIGAEGVKNRQTRW